MKNTIHAISIKMTRQKNSYACFYKNICNEKVDSCSMLHPSVYVVQDNKKHRLERIDLITFMEFP